MYAGGGAARLLLVAAFAAAVADDVRRPRSKPTRVYRPNKDAVQLLEHVMMYEEQWTDILDEHILLLGDPPHQGRMLDAPLLGPMQDIDAIKKGEVPIYDVRKILTTITNHYSAIRSFVEYGAKAVRGALACYTFKQVFFQWKGIRQLIDDEADPILIEGIADTMKKNTSKYIDLLSTVADDDLTIILDVYWRSIELLQYNGVQHINRYKYPSYLKESTKELLGSISDFMISNCLTYSTEEEFYRRTGVPKKTPMLMDPYLEPIIASNTMAEMIIEQAEHMILNAQHLNIVTMTDNTWSSLFFYRDRPRTDSTKVQVKSDPSASEAKPESKHEDSSPPSEDA